MPVRLEPKMILPTLSDNVPFKIERAWDVYELNDDGKKTKLVSTHPTYAAAHICARGRGRGSELGLIEEVAILCYEGLTFRLADPYPITLNHGLEEAQARLKAYALAKLTLEERRVLGLEE